MVFEIVIWYPSKKIEDVLARLGYKNGETIEESVAKELSFFLVGIGLNVMLLCVSYEKSLLAIDEKRFQQR